MKCIQFVLFTIIIITSTVLKGQVEVGLDSTTFETKVTINNVLENNGMIYPVADGIADQIMTTDGSGELFWSNPLSFEGYEYLCQNPSDHIIAPFFGISSDTCGYLYDSGGEFGQYSNNESRIFTILPANSFYTRVILLNLNTEVNRDTLWIQGKFYTGTIASADTLIFDGGSSVLVEFQSDEINTDNGFKIFWDRYYYNDNPAVVPFAGFHFDPMNSSVGGGVNIDSSWENSGGKSVYFGYGADAQGEKSIAIGNRSEANSLNAVAIGNSSKASGNNAVAIGPQNNVSDGVALGRFNTVENGAILALGSENISNADEGISIGWDNLSSGETSMAMGSSNTASGDQSVTQGFNNLASGNSSLAMGKGSQAISDESLAIGISSSSQGLYSSAVGYLDTATGGESNAIGYLNRATGFRSSALGMNNLATGSVSSAIGGFNSATGLNSTAVGRSNTSTAEQSSAFGYLNTASGWQSLAVGYNNEATQFATSAVGNNNDATSTSSSAFGVGNTSSAFNSSTFGSFNNATASRASAFGYSNTAISENASAFGHDNDAIGINSVSVGSLNESLGDFSSSFGYQNEANGLESVALGLDNLAGGEQSMALGANNSASNYRSVAIGNSSLSSGIYGTALGNNVDASAPETNAIGFYCESDIYAQTVIGRWNRPISGSSNNWFGDEPAFVVGIGQTNNDLNNGLVILKNGKIGIGSDFPLHKLSVAGVVAPVVDNFYDLGTSLHRWEDVYATNGTIQTSDRRDKKNIEEIHYGLKDLMKLRPVTYSWSDDIRGERKLGLIAQDLLEVLPEVVKTHDDIIIDQETNETEYQELSRIGVYYSDIIPVLIKGFQEQQEMIKDQVEVNQELNTQMTKQAKIIDHQTLLIQDLIKRIENLEK